MGTTVRVLKYAPLLLCLSLTACLHPAQRAAGTGARAQLERAHEAREAGQPAEALAMYEDLAATAPPGEARGSEALWWAAVLRLAPDPALGDREKARAHLERLAAIPGADAEGRRAAAEGVLALLDALAASAEAQEAARADAALAEQEHDARTAAFLQQIADLEKGFRAEKERADRLDKENGTLKTDLNNTIEALKKVKEALLGWKPSP